MSTETAGVPTVSHNGGDHLELIDSRQLAERWRVPESWIRNHTRSRTPKEARIPCVRLGKYVRFRWDSPELADWLAKQQR